MFPRKNEFQDNKMSPKVQQQKLLKKNSQNAILSFEKKLSYDVSVK